MNFIPAEIIKKKKRGEANTDEEILFMIENYSRGDLPDYQMSAWAMAINFQEMNENERATLTLAMRDSGYVYDFTKLGKPCVDKHSTGGVGDKASLILAPIVAAAGVPVPMIAGRGLGHTGGTLDKLEAIPGFQVYINRDLFIKNVSQNYLAIMGQTDDICPADKKLYALRDVTGTVDSLSLISASIMSKKLAEGLQGLVMDVKFGNGAFMKTPEEAEQLALSLKQIGENNGVHVTTLLTNMNQPLGKFIGNALEVKESLDILKGESCVENGFDFYQDTLELSLNLAAHMIRLGGKAESLEQGLEIAQEKIASGKALEKFYELCQSQGGAQIDKLPKAPHQHTVLASQEGYVQDMQTEKIGVTAIKLKAGRKTPEDVIDPTSGIEMHFKVGHKINRGEALFTLYSQDSSLFAEVERDLLSTFNLSSQPTSELKLIHKVIY